jgi:hypothetical protein
MSDSAKAGSPHDAENTHSPFRKILVAPQLAIDALLFLLIWSALYILKAAMTKQESVLEHYHLQTWGWPYIIVQSLALLFAIVLFSFTRRRYFSPISGVPGPFLASFSRIWHIRSILAGNSHLDLSEQHDKYGKKPCRPTWDKTCTMFHRAFQTSLTAPCLGHFVRIAHSEVSVSHPNAVKQLLLASIQKVIIFRNSQYAV